MKSDRVETAHDPQARLGEGPVWDHRTGRLIWLGILAGVVHAFDPTTG